MVSRPRNQRYLRPRRFPAGAFVCELEEGREFAVELDPQRAVERHESDLIDQIPDRLGGFEAGLILVECGRSMRLHLAP